jgi:hypothetical protein
MHQNSDVYGRTGVNQKAREYLSSFVDWSAPQYRLRNVAMFTEQLFDSEFPQTRRQHVVTTC